MKQYILCLLLFMLLSGCTEPKEKLTEVDSTKAVENKHTEAEDSETEETGASGIYYRMACERQMDIDEVMYALFTSAPEREAYAKTELEEETSAWSDVVTRRGVMEVDGLVHRWEECDGKLVYQNNSPVAYIGLGEAEKMAEEFLTRLGWEYDPAWQLEAMEDGSVEFQCRLYCNGVKMMGEHSLFFEPDNDNEVGVTGSYLSLILSGAGIQNMAIAAVPQTGEVLQTYDSSRDFLSPEQVEATVKQYLEIQAQRQPQNNMDLETLHMKMELIYMPYRDPAGDYEQILLPAYEVRIPNGSEDTRRTTVFYVDAVTGFIYDKDIEF